MADLRLKDYQQLVLDKLRDYFRRCSQFSSASTAFYHLTQRPYTEIAELPGLPYVCLRLPTGAGKTYVACHALPIAARELLQTERSLALWLVPSNAIREQTLKALKDRQHPYRRALDSLLGNVAVLDVGEALYLTRPTLDTGSVVIVSTIQAFRVEDTEGRKVYETNGALMDHFSGYEAAALAGLETYENGTIKYSLANVLRLRRPIILVDEAHNARTQLSFDTLARFDPACIIELTATPDIETSPSNVLHQVSAAELRAEDMVKLPIVLETRPHWKELLGDAIAQLNQLEKLAQAETRATGEYLRPVMLLQAQPRRKDQDTLTVQMVEKTLIEDFGIPKAHIARATGEDKDLDGVKIEDPTCPLRFVITVQALKEGWDCPFAYVLCSVAELYSPTAVEQILGRVMRLPQARRKQQAELNQAYAFVASNNFMSAAERLKDGLVQNGFERIEAERLVRAPDRPVQPTLDFGPLFADQPPPQISVITPEAPDLSVVPDETVHKLRYDELASAIVVSAPLTQYDREALSAAFSSEIGHTVVEQVFVQSQRVVDKRSPAERGTKFSVPMLAYRQDDLLSPFEESHFLEHTWRLAQQDPALTEGEYALRQGSVQRAAIDIGDRHTVQIKFMAELHEQMRMLASDRDWTEADLISWLDRTISHPDITFAQSTAFITAAVQKLQGERNVALAQLVHDKYRLRQAVAAKIDTHRQAARNQAYQQLLLPESPLEVTPELCFTYDPYRYPCTPYRGNYQFFKHFYPEVGGFDSGEEEACAIVIDTLPKVDTWVRNPDRGTRAFWLQTSSDKFYPDFVCKLQDGRFLVVEYKGADRWSNDDSREKRTIGEVWEKRSNGQCLFIMPKGKDFEAIRAKL